MIILDQLPTGCSWTHRCYHWLSRTAKKDSWKVGESIILRNTDIHAEHLTFAFEFITVESARLPIISFAVLVRAGPDIDCGVCLEEFVGADLEWLRDADTFKEWSENVTRKTLHFSLHSSLYTSADIFVQAAVRKEQRLGKDFYRIRLTILKD